MKTTCIAILLAATVAAPNAAAFAPPSAAVCRELYKNNVLGYKTELFMSENDVSLRDRA
jgi:hypothetical protein